MALERIYKTKSPDTALIEIPQVYTDSMLSLIAAVCNLGPRYEVDSVFRNYCIHRWPYQPWMPPSIEVKVDTNYAWAKQWFLGNKLTGNAAIDSFMSRHQVTMSSYFAGASSSTLNNWATLKAAQPINMKAFGDSMAKFPGVSYYQYRGTVIGDGDQILCSQDSAWHLSFIAGWGDCPSGCTSWKVWKYTVDSNCDVSLDTIYSWRQPWDNRPMTNCYPWGVSATHTTRSTTNASVYPNPANNILNISGIEAGLLHYTISDATGRSLLSGTSFARQVNVSTLPAGFYTILLQSPAHTTTARRFIIQ